MNGVSHHAKQRINQRRNNVVHTNNKSLFTHIKKKGVLANDLINDIKNTPLSKYLNYLVKRNRNLVVMLYQNYIFIMTKNKSKVITTFPLPEQYIGDFRDYLFCGKINCVEKEEAIYLVKLWNKQRKPISTDKYFASINDANNYIILRLQQENCTKSYYTYFNEVLNKTGKYISFYKYCLNEGFAELIQIQSEK